MAYTSKDCGDAITIQLPPFLIRRQMYFALNPKNAIYNPITGEINKGVELQESVYLLTYKLFSISPINDPIIQKSNIDINNLKFDERFDYADFDPRNQ